MTLALPSSEALCEWCSRPLLAKRSFAGLCDSCGERSADLRHDESRGWNDTEQETSDV